MARIIREYRTSVGSCSYLIVVTAQAAGFVAHVFRADAYGHMRPLVNGNRWPIEFQDHHPDRALDRALKFVRAQSSIGARNQSRSA